MKPGVITIHSWPFVYIYLGCPLYLLISLWAAQAVSTYILNFPVLFGSDLWDIHLVWWQRSLINKCTTTVIIIYSYHLALNDRIDDHIRNHGTLTSACTTSDYASKNWNPSSLIKCYSFIEIKKMIIFIFLIENI